MNGGRIVDQSGDRFARLLDDGERPPIGRLREEDLLAFGIDVLLPGPVAELERRVAKVMRPVINTFSPVPLPEDECFTQIKTLYESLRGIDKGYARLDH